MTYSIVARDPKTGELGVAVQTCWFAVGSVVPWVEPGVGAIATQSFTETAYGPGGLTLLREGVRPKEALRRLVAADPGAARRQVAMVDARGRLAVHTGSGCVPAAGQETGAGFSVQANMMERDSVWGAMAAAFEASEGELPERMIVALRAAEAEGGDMRGRQSAALVVVAGERSERPWERIVDIRVDDHRQPLDELERLVALSRAYRRLDAAEELLMQDDLEAAAGEAAVAHALAPKDGQVLFDRGLILAKLGRRNAAAELLRRADTGGGDAHRGGGAIGDVLALGR